MSRSPRRANARISCRGACVKRLINDEWVGARRGEHRCIRKLSLSAAFEKESIQQQQDHGADDRHDPASDVILARKDLTDPRPNKRAGDAKQNGDDATAGISSRHQQFRDRTDDKTNKNGPNP